MNAIYDYWIQYRKHYKLLWDKDGGRVYYMCTVHGCARDFTGNKIHSLCYFMFPRDLYSIDIHDGSIQKNLNIQVDEIFKNPDADQKEILKRMYDIVEKERRLVVLDAI